MVGPSVISLVKIFLQPQDAVRQKRGLPQPQDCSQSSAEAVDIRKPKENQCR